MVKLLVTMIPALLILVVAVLSVQNATLMPITFLTTTTVELPFGVWIAFAVSVGMVGTAILLGLFGLAKKASRS